MASITRPNRDTPSEQMTSTVTRPLVVLVLLSHRPYWAPRRLRNHLRNGRGFSRGHGFSLSFSFNRGRGSSGRRASLLLHPPPRLLLHLLLRRRAWPFQAQRRSRECKVSQCPTHQLGPLHSRLRCTRRQMRERVLFAGPRAGLLRRWRLGMLLGDGGQARRGHAPPWRESQLVPRVPPSPEPLTGAAPARTDTPQALQVWELRRADPKQPRPSQATQPQPRATEAQPAAQAAVITRPVPAGWPMAPRPDGPWEPLRAPPAPAQELAAPAPRA